ncbi:MAG: lysophospholipase [Desulfobulbaceae bacterium]|jgi:alpha-beta hydrolase superfamily lysophospholipase
MMVIHSLIFLAAGCLLLSSCAPHIAASGPVTGEPRLEGELFVSFDGSKLPLRKWLPAGRTRVVVIALHGFNDYSNFINDAALYFRDRGIAVYAYDQRGFGEAPHRGKWAGREAMIRDLRTVIPLVRERHPGIPLYLLGESMGGAVIMTAEATGSPLPADGVILSAPAVWSRRTMPFYQRWLLALAARTIPWATLTPEHLDIKPSDNREMLKKLSQDPLVIKKSRVDAIYGLANLMDGAYESADRYDHNTLLLYGARDEIIPPKPMRHVFRQRLNNTFSRPQRILVYPDGYHMLLRDLQAEVVWNDILAWMTAPAGRFPSVENGRAREVTGEEDIEPSLRFGPDK